MDNSVFVLIPLFVAVNIVQVWLILKPKPLIKGGIIVGLLEILEFLLMVYLLLKGQLVIFLILVTIEIIQWLTIAYFSTKD